MSKEEKIINEAKEKLEEVFGVEKEYEPAVGDEKFDKEEFIDKLQEEAASEEASIKARKALRDQIAKEAKEKIDIFFNEEQNYQPEETELDFDQDEYVAKIKEKVAEIIKK